VSDPIVQISDTILVMRETGGRRERVLTVLPEADVDDRIDDELPVVLAPAEDRPNLHVPPELGELRHGVAQFEIDAAEELALVGIGADEQLPDLGGIGIEPAVLVDRIRRVEAHLPPIGDAVGPFAGPVQRMVGNDTAWKLGLLASDEGIVRVYADEIACCIAGGATLSNSPGDFEDATVSCSARAREWAPRRRASGLKLLWFDSPSEANSDGLLLCGYSLPP
jgi:hypothetical protein